MKKLVGVSRISDDEMRVAVNKLSEEEKEDIIQKLCVSHTVFDNWMSGKSRLTNSKMRNQLIGLLGI